MKHIYRLAYTFCMNTHIKQISYVRYIFSFYITWYCIYFPVSGRMAEAPPPCNEAVVGAHTLISFQDFWPRCLNREQKAKYATFETFE